MAVKGGTRAQTIQLTKNTTLQVLAQPTLGKDAAAWLRPTVIKKGK
jgi:hypothetical protein